MPKDCLEPEDSAEAVASFRSATIGTLTRRDLDHGEFRAEPGRRSARPAPQLLDAIR